ncbi:hypothetical protein K474DRAFT_1645251 [Panus rudis PR-1116 ss-1]|nr:hypothetical protein K474DRAFT_1645251 [Panus rudis PR-1116 ss-1]
MSTRDADEKTELIQNGKAGDGDTGLADLIQPIFLLPFTLLFKILNTAVRLIKPFAPQLIPLAVFSLAIPIIGFLSISAGWFVWRSIAVGWEIPLYLQYGDGLPPYAKIALPPIAVQQPYDISLHLVVPATESNYALGNFMATLTLSTPSNTTLSSVRRPAIVLPSSSLIPFSSAYQQGTTSLDIPLLTSYQPKVSSVNAYVELGRSDFWKSIGKGEGREISVSSALLRGVVVHKGIRGLITRFPLLTALISSGTFFFISFIVLASCLLPAIEWRFHRDHADLQIDNDKPKGRRSPRSPRSPRPPKSERDEWSDALASTSSRPRRSQSAGASRRSSVCLFLLHLL